MYDYRPEILFKRTYFQKICNLIGYGVFIIGVIVSIVSLAFLPDSVPIHFNFVGEADGWGSKYFILLLPLIGLITTLGIESLENKPHMHNYPARINESNVEQFYKLSIRSMNLMKNAMLIVFGLLMFDIIITAKMGEPLFQMVIWIVLVVGMLAIIVGHIFSMRKI